jgi:hypothetical protein
LNKSLENVCEALDALATEVTNAWQEEKTVGERFEGYAPFVTKHDLANFARRLATDIQSADTDVIDPNIQKLVADLPRRLRLLQQTTVHEMFHPNKQFNNVGITAYISTIMLIRDAVLPGIGWQVIPNPEALPARTVKRARAAQAQLDQLEPDLGQLSKQIKDIQSAHAIADSLPIDLQALSEAREKISKSAAEIAVKEEKIELAWSSSYRHLDWMKGHNEEAKKLIELCEAAYQITTTKGLASAFDQRASKLGWSMWAWVGGLIIALGVGSLIGAHRLEILSTELQTPNPHWGSIAIQAVLSFLSVGAPLWFAWLATKQIGQRFRLAEDYAFKASVAKAYEGYRKEAARIDPDFEHRLFGSALTRLDEAPLRLVETGTHGSPWHELANSETVRRILDATPELRDKMIGTLRELRELVTTNAKPLRKRAPATKSVAEDSAK